MVDDTNLARLKDAYNTWDSTKGGSTDDWLDLMSDEVSIHSIGEEGAGISFARDRYSKREAVEYLAGILSEWTMIHWTPETYVSEGDLIAMFGRCAWTHKVTGKSADVRIAHLWQFRQGKIVEFTEVFDSARAAAAATS